MGTERSVLETVIMGETVRLSTDAGEEHLRKISEYINEKAKEIQRMKRGLPTTTPLFRLLVNVNLADDFLTAQARVEELKARVSELELELKARETKLEQELKAREAELKQELKARETKLKQELKARETELEQELAKARQEIKDYEELFEKD